MDLERMLDKCRKGQWSIDDLDWSVAPRRLERDQEIAIVQYFTDMAGIERIAGDLFTEQAARAVDPTLKAIFETFIADEIRHAECAARLATHYDVNHYRRYEEAPSLVRFRPAFRQAIKHFSAEVTNLYVTGGELLLDVALLRSIDDFVDDAMSRQVMDRINRDESRHIAIDYHMTEHYASAAYQAQRARQPKPSLRERTEALGAFGLVLFHMRPFAQAVFLEPMAVVDPNSKRMQEAWKRIQLLIGRPDVAARPFPRVIHTVQRAGELPLVGRLLSGVLGRLAGLPDALLTRIVDDREQARACATSIDDLAEGKLAA